MGNTDRARAVYHRVLEHDPENESAKTSLETLAPAADETPEPEAAEAAAPAADDGGGDYVDLGALLMDDEPQFKDTRMRIEEEEPTGDEEKDFDEMLSAFKKGIEENVAEEDWQAHYDLGVAFKEMGLLDEAIAEFQKALRAPEGRLRTAEALGTAFFEKGQYSVTGTVLRRAIDSEPGSDESKIGLLYWLARCEEEQGRGSEALVFYQRVFAVDINFQDVQDRVRQLSESGA
jgi:tetratricopeptide (TPR) repeat protein